MGAIANIYKQNMIFPPPSGPGGSEDEKKQGWKKRMVNVATINDCAPGFKNIVRGIGLAVLATFAGCFVVYTLPDIVSQAANRVMPYWFYEYEVRGLLALTACCCLSCVQHSAHRPHEHLRTDDGADCRDMRGAGNHVVLLSLTVVSIQSSCSLLVILIIVPKQVCMTRQLIALCWPLLSRSTPLLFVLVVVQHCSCTPGTPPTPRLLLHILLHVLQVDVHGVLLGMCTTCRHA